MSNPYNPSSKNVTDGQRVPCSCGNLNVVTSGNNPCVDATQTTAGQPVLKITGTAAGDANATVSTLTTPGAVQAFAQIDLNGAKRWVAIYADPS